jgi:hypothetical protein
LIYKDPFTHVYKKHFFTKDEKYLLGEMMVAYTNDYFKLLPIGKRHKKLEIVPGEFDHLARLGAMATWMTCEALIICSSSIC